MEVFYSLSAGSRHVMAVLEIFYALTGLTDLLLLVATLILMMRASKRLTLYDHIKYENEKKRFLINLKLVIVLIATWPFEYLVVVSVYLHFNMYTLITIEFIKVFSSLMIFAILMFRKNVRMLICKKYQELTNTLEQ